MTQRGTHSQLLRQEGLYAELWRRQRLEEELEHDPEPGGDGEVSVEGRADVG